MVLRKTSRPNTITSALPAPVGGWNARDSLAEMGPSDAVILDNIFPLASSVQLRKGYTQQSTGLPGQVETLMAYNSPTGTQTLFGISSGSIYNCTTAGAVGAAVVSSLTNSRFQYINISTSGGNFLMAVNGADKLRGWDGSAWWTDGDGVHDITGLDTSTVIDLNMHKNRIWLIVKNSLKAWYLGTNSIAGAATGFDLSSVADNGGSIMAMGTWTIDAGYGVDDLAVFITSVGEIIVYRGTDVSSSNTWALVGIWKLGSPLGRRCLTKYAGDLLILSQDGLLPLAAALQSSRVNPKVALSNKIQTAMSNAAMNYGGNFGWQVIYYPQANMLLVNIPVQVGANQQQFVMNTITKAWGSFGISHQGFQANCWELFNDQLYFGGDQYVGLAWTTSADNGTAITADCLQAFSHFGNPAQLKRWTMAKPTFQSNGVPTLLMNINVDFQDLPPSASLSSLPSIYGTWDSGVWDSAIWGSDLSASATWQGLNGIGYWGAPRLLMSGNGIDVRWVATELVMEKGGIL